MIHTRSHGFTLLEVLLALALTALILVALGMAVDFHFRVLDTGRAHVEEAQLARVLLRRIADDLRGAVVANVESLSQAAQSATSSGDTSSTTKADKSSTYNAQLPSSGNKTGTSTGTVSDALSSATDSVGAHATPGIYGSSYAIQVDVSRLPQPYQLQAFYSNNAETSSPTSYSDVKTVTYMVGGTQNDTGINLPAELAGQQGLIRCEQDRAVAIYQAEHGGGGTADMSGALLAPEVAGIEFAYCDGTQWLDAWDSTQNLGLPAAVRVTIYVTPIRSKQGRSRGFGGVAQNSLQTEGALAYSLLVSIPVKLSSQSLDSGASSSSEDSGSGSGGDTDTGNGATMGGSSGSTSKSGGSSSGGGKSGGGTTGGSTTGGGGRK